MTGLIELRDLSRIYQSGDETVIALDSVNLSIEAGEMIAIVGASGSGKSTLMNILGCLDQASSGSYRINGQETTKLLPDELARLRREHFGFIFQRYHLMADLTATGNVEIPAIYAGAGAASRRERAHSLLVKLGLGDRLWHRPGQLSGGQQQRVSIARALMNGGELILADEPTGALDSKSGETVMAILKGLHREGHTVIIVTHDAEIAEYAGRVIEIRDGRIVVDRRKTEAAGRRLGVRELAQSDSFSGYWRRLHDALRMAFRSMAGHRLRTFLTTLGIVIGIAAVVIVSALGEGSRRKVLTQVAELGVSTISVYPGRDWGDERASSIRTLVPEDALGLAGQPYIDSVSPVLSMPGIARAGNVAMSLEMNGVDQGFFRVNNLTLDIGRFFDQREVRARSQVAIIDDNLRRRLFPGGADPIGQIIMVQRLPVVIAGVLAPRSARSGSNRSLRLYLPYTTVQARISGSQSSLSEIAIRVSDRVDTRLAERAIVSFLERRHGLRDFFVFNSDQYRKTFENTSRTMSLLISAVAAIALIVGGIGVMNIMLVSVTERTREIGLRMAIGARRIDIMLQFQIETLAICIAGATLGVGLALAVYAAFGASESEFPMILTSTSFAIASTAAVAVGLLFGYLPARNAARLDPVMALSHE